MNGFRHSGLVGSDQVRSGGCSPGFITFGTMVQLAMWLQKAHSSLTRCAWPRLSAAGMWNVKCSHCLR